MFAQCKCPMALASETHDVARWPFKGRSHEGRERGSRLRTRDWQQRRCAVSGAGIAYVGVLS
jgi:hypothetical protein